MPFTAECNAARGQFQQAHTAWVTTLAARRAAWRIKNGARIDRDNAKRELDNAKTVQATAEAAWDAIIARIAAGPTFGIPNVEAKFEPSGASTMLGGQEGIPVGSFPIRPDKKNMLWGKSELPDALTSWTNVADAELTRTRFLASDAKRRKTETELKQNAFNIAKQNLQTAEAALTVADQAVNAAKAALDSVEAQMQAKCTGQTETTNHGGIDIETHPGVLPEDKDKIKDALDKAKDSEKKDLDEIEIKDEGGRTFEWTDAKGVKHTGTVAGTYGGDDITIYGGGISDKAEETVKHEIGHHVYDKRLTDEGRDKWDEFWNENDNKKNVRDGGKMPSDYAGRNSDEGFAECYARLRCDGTIDPVTKAKMEEVLRMLKP